MLEFCKGRCSVTVMRWTIKPVNAYGGLYMEDSKKVIKYKDHTIEVMPQEARCSLFAVTIFNKEGREVKHSSRAGKNETIAFENAKKMIDFDIEYEKQETEE